MNDTFITVLLILCVFVVLPIGLFVVRDIISKAMWRKQNPPKKLATERMEYEENIKNPDWRFYENHLQRIVPQEIRDLWADHNLITSVGLKYDDAHSISTFNPINEESLIKCRDIFEKDIIPIATTDFGDPVYLKPGCSEPDALYITYHDGGDTDVFEVALVDFVGKLKRHG